MRPLIPRVLSCQRHGWPSISTWRCRQALAAYPKASDEQSSNAFCLALLPMRLAMRPTVTSGPVVSYTAVSPLPVEDGRSVLCCAISQVTLGGRYPPSCSMEPGSSSTDGSVAAIKRSQMHYDSKKTDERKIKKTLFFLRQLFSEITMLRLQC